MVSPASVEEAGNALLQPYATVDELLNRITNLDRLLQRVEQQPPQAMQIALKTPIEALATDELLKSVDLNVKIHVGCCICEIARITAPEPPYEENKMRDVSDLLLTVIKSLSFVTGNAYRKASLVLHIVSRSRLFNAMWDCDEAFIIEMFQEFLHLQINHANNVICEMERIMTLLLNEEGVPREIFLILLNSLRRDNEILYPVSYNLAERVFHNCADVLKQSLPIEVRLSEIVPHDYSEVVARVFNAGKELVLQENSTKEVGPSAALPLESLKNDEAPATRKDDTRKAEILKETSEIELTQSRASSVINHSCYTSNVKAPHDLKSEECFGSSSSAVTCDDSDKVPDIAAVQTEPEELNRPLILETRNTNSNEESMKNNGSSILLQVGDGIKGQNVSEANCPQVEDSDPKTIVLDESNAERVSPNTEDNKCDVATLLHQPTDLEIVSTSRKRGCKPNFLLKLEEGYDGLWVDSGKRSSDAPLRRRNNRKDLKGPSPSVIKDSLVESERFPSRKRSRKGKPRSAYHTMMEDENLESSSSRMGSKKLRNGGVKHSGEKNLPKRLASPEASETPSKEFDLSLEVKHKKNSLFKEDVSVQGNGEALVGSKIRVYWPMDNKFYEGSIISFDIETKKYKVIYDDGDAEVLDLAREQFELLGNDVETDRVQLSDDDDALTLYDLLKKTLTSRPSSKKRKLASHAGIEKLSASNVGRLEVVDRSNSKQDQPIEIVNPADLNSPGQKIQDKTHSKSRGLKLGEAQTKLVMPTPSFSVPRGTCFHEIANPHRHQEKSSSILIRDAILKRYGDITANCLYKSQSMRESLLDVVCNVVGRLNNSVVTTSDIKAMTLEISDAADAKLDVSWLQKFLVDIAHEEEAARTASDTRTTTIFTIGAAQKEVEHRQVELAAAKINIRDAKRRVEALKCVLKKIDTNLLMSVAREKSWKKRLDELLTSSVTKINPTGGD